MENFHSARGEVPREHAGYSYYFMVGRLQDAQEQRGIAQGDYDALMLDWAALDNDTQADKELRQKKATVEECLQKACRRRIFDAT